MQLVNPQRGTSFYESFSDLIFGTLIIFLVVVLALMVRIKAKQGEYEQAAQREIAMHQYAGGTSQTEWAMAFVIVEGRPMLAVFPQAAWSKIGVVRFEDSNPVLELAKLFVKDPALIPMFEVETFRGMSTGMSQSMVKGAVIYTGLGDILSRMYAVREAAGGSLSGWTPEQLVEAVGGMRAGEHVEEDRPSEAAAKGRDAYFAFIAGPGEPLPDGHEDQFFRQYDKLTSPIEPGLEATANLPPRVRFTTTEDRRFEVGRSKLSAQQFRGLLDSLSVGKGFFLEYDGPGDFPENPPRWVITDVLIPAGFDRRLPSDAAIDLLERKRTEDEG